MLCNGPYQRISTLSQVIDTQKAKFKELADENEQIPILKIQVSLKTKIHLLKKVSTQIDFCRIFGLASPLQLGHLGRGSAAIRLWSIEKI